MMMTGYRNFDQILKRKKLDILIGPTAFLHPRARARVCVCNRERKTEIT